jgi:hypothetical protein
MEKAPLADFYLLKRRMKGKKKIKKGYEVSDVRTIHKELPRRNWRLRGVDKMTHATIVHLRHLLGSW